MEFMDVIKQRRSVRKFKDKPIPTHIIKEMLEAARLAPSGGNGQNHFFGIIDDIDLKHKLAIAAGNQMWIESAPLVIACCVDVSYDLREVSEEDFGLIVNKLRFTEDFIDYLCRYPDRRTCMTLFENCAPLIPTEHIFLTATAHGLNACFIGYLDVNEASSILKLPENKKCLFLLPVGYADESIKDKERKSIESISFYNNWGTDMDLNNERSSF